LENTTLALESFQKTLISNNSLYDQKIKNKTQIPSKDALDGEKLFFETAKCNTCHKAPLFSDDDFHQVEPKNELSNNKIKDYGLSDITGNEENKNFFRTPSLRNASLTAPYWHDGSAKTLVEAIQKHDLKINQKLSMEEINKLIAFIDTLTDYSFINNPKYSRPNKECNY
jgi:cytochrome c peroxidase